ncbi:hypothetical protein HMPREF9628_01041 [Peptoanaerobacter stomatis]|uniref:Monogalactosyldiacylglycerol synthase, C-terminal domain protein n=1 Tax=Peptoanaerobacter stomatis TaxID=796937 RepID=G9XAM4_9FIRM|nr:glycosyltransferase [Peptoanaerobacter stomatis]EHL20044.1 hypothetical protein HMPREF9628_01041 [Peptoanaerobacter stomatis]
MQKKVMILTASTGGGHNKASNAIKKQLDILNIESEIVDSLKDIGKVGRLLNIMISGGYEKSAQYIPKVYGTAYNASDGKFIRKTFDWNFIISYMERNILKKIEEENITHIITTHAFPGIAVSNLKEKGKINIPLYSLITDYTVHVAHVAKDIDKYIVAHEDTGVLLKSFKVEQEKIYPLGIPIDMKDYDISDTKRWKAEKDIDDKFTVLIMGGSFGAGDIISVYKQIENLHEDINIIVICGRNEHLKERLERRIYRKKPKNKTVVVGFTDEIERYYQISDVIITKPGGLTITECIHEELPMIIPFFIPGQEEGNRDFLVNNQMALYTSRYFSLDMLIKCVIENPEKLEIIKSSMRRNKKIDTAKKIAELFL